MKRWNLRPIEIRNLFNPAFCGLVLFRALQAYEEEDPRGMPFSLSLLVLPLCLHKDSRGVFADSPKSHLIKTVEAHPQLQAGFADRVTAILPYTFEAFGLLTERGCISISDDGRLQTVPETVRKSVTGTAETKSCQRVARFLGKQFAHIADSVTVYTTFGVRP